MFEQQQRLRAGYIRRTEMYIPNKVRPNVIRQPGNVGVWAGNLHKGSQLCVHWFSASMHRLTVFILSLGVVCYGANIVSFTEII